MVQENIEILYNLAALHVVPLNDVNGPEDGLIGTEIDDHAVDSATVADVVERALKET